MAKSLENFMSDVQKGGDTRVQELQKAWEEQHPGEPYPGSDGLGEKVGPRDQLQAQNEKGKEKVSDEDAKRRGELEAMRTAQIKQKNDQLTAASRPDGYPPKDMMAWGVPDKVAVPSTGTPSVQESNNTTTA